MENRNELLNLVIKAHGGLERWNQLKQVKLHLPPEDTSGQ